MLIKELLWKMLFAHNPQHSISFKIFGRTVHTCTRCTGMYIGAVLFLPVIYLASLNETYNFWYIFGLSWILASFAIIDWSLVKAGRWHGDNNIRMLTGYMLGVAGVLYLFLLPVPPFYRMISLCSYKLVFNVIQYAVKCKEYELSLRNPVHQNLAVIAGFTPLAVGGCTQTGGTGQCCTACPCGDALGCLCSPLSFCLICTCPTICIAKWWMDKNKKVK